MELELYDHQKKALRKLANGRILWGGVGTGKSRVAVSYYIQNEAPKDVIVLTTAKKRDAGDWSDEFYNAGVGPKARAGQILGNTVDVRERTDKLEEGAGDGRTSGNSGPGLVCTEEILQACDRDRKPCGGCRDGFVERASAREGFGSTGDGDRSESDIPRENKGKSKKSRINTSSGETSTYPYSVTIDSWNRIGKYVNVTGAFFICDEQRLVGTGSWVKSFLRIAKNNTWILLSGTPGDSWLDYAPVFIANGLYRNITDFKRQHVVYSNFTKFPKVDRYVDVGRLARQRGQLLVEMPYERHTKRRHVEVDLPYDKDTLDLVLTKRWHVFEDRPLRDVGEMFLVMRRVVNSDPSRLEMVCELWKNHPKLIVFYNFNYELESLRSLREYYDLGLMRNTLNQKTPSGLEIPKTPGSIKTTEINNRLISTSSEVAEWKVNDNGLLSPSTSNSSLTMVGSLHPSEKNTSSLSVESLERFSASDCNKKSAIALSPTSSDSALPEFAIAEWNGHKHQPIPLTDRWLYLVQYTAGAEGWNCTETDAMVMYSRNYSWKVTEQAYGRVDRLNTPFTDLWYYDFTSNSMIDKAIGRALKAKESFNEAKFKRLFK